MAVTLMDLTNQLGPAPRHGLHVLPLLTAVQSVPHNQWLLGVSEFHERRCEVELPSENIGEIRCFSIGSQWVNF